MTSSIKIELCGIDQYAAVGQRVRLQPAVADLLCQAQRLVGTTTWHPEEVSGPGTVWGGVAMTHSDGGIQIAAPGPGGSIMFFWAADGTSTWHPVQVAGPGTMQGAPAMAAGNYTMEIAITATDGSLRYYWSHDGTPTWYGAQIAPPGTASGSPAMTRSNGATEIAVAGP